MQPLRAKRVGYFGKVPPTGDFVSRNLDGAVKEGFDRWLGQGLDKSRAQLKDGWLSSFLTAPVWRFLLDRQLDGGKLVAGIMMPSVDKVGRYFPFSILVELENAPVDSYLLGSCDQLLEQFEDLLLSALAEDFDLDYFDYQIGMAARKLVGKDLADGTLAVSRFNELRELDRQLHRLQPSGGSVWWTDGAERRKADLLIYEAMPGSGAFASMLRDPDAFRDLEAIWDQARGLGLSQSDNLSVDFTGSLPGLKFHLISHNGKDQPANTAYAGQSPEMHALILSDGRFGTVWSAMVSRCLTSALADAWDSEKKTLKGAGLQRISGFLSEKLLLAQQSILAPPLSFACIAASGPQEISVFVSGGYICFHKSAQSVSRVFGAYAPPDGPTIRQEPDGWFRSVKLALAPGDRVLIGSSIFDFPAIAADIIAAMDQATVGAAAKTAWQNAAIRGLSGNIALAVLEASAG
jgi:type VI secretion system protein ImpM